VVLVHRVVVVALVGDGMRDALPGILDDALALDDGTDGERTLAGEGGITDFERE
jgi:hypothetical protein